MTDETERRWRQLDLRLAELEMEMWVDGTVPPVSLLGVETVWEKCTGTCGREYRYPYLCRKHMLCGECHEGVPL
jgi:hypothetical protein